MRETLPRPFSSPLCSSVASSTPRHQLGQAAWSWIASQTGSRGDSKSQVVRKAYSAIAPSLRRRSAPGSVVVRGLAVPQVGGRRLDDLREADDRHLVVLGDRAAVDLLEEAHLLLEAAELGVVVLDVPPAKVAGALHLDVVDDCGEDLLPLAVAETDGDPDDLPALVL